MASSQDSKKIVIVEDNKDLAEVYKIRLELSGYSCFIAYNGITGLYFIQKQLPDLVLLDLMVPDVAGDQILLRMRASNWGKDIPVLIISNLNEKDAPSGLRNLGIAGYEVKANMSIDELEKIVTETIKLSMPPPHVRMGTS
jgi:DNA-binding response OmpR family regulator